ncbi:MAG: outer membrane beta-barrel protein [Muribaculaceae bacterium]|nr:outer membrane beta-barrel protein [Muribaculaceae bacterium]
MRISRRIAITMIAAAATAISCGAVSFVDKSRSEEPIKIEAHLNIGLSSLSQNYAKVNPDILELNFRPGTMFGAGVLVEFPLRDFLSLGTGTDINICNSRYTAIVFSSDPDVTGYAAVRNRYIYASFPVYMSVGFNISDNVRWHVDGGIYYAYGFGGFSKTSVYTTHENELGQIVTEHHEGKGKYFNDHHALMHRTGHSDIGLHFATGFVFDNHYHISLGYRHGLRDIARNDGPSDPKAFNAIATLSIGYKF